MSDFLCPYCSRLIAISDGTFVERTTSFESGAGRWWTNDKTIVIDDSCININFYKCPHCNQYTIKSTGIGKQVNDVNVPIRPLSSAKHFPSYVPEAIRSDYKESYLIAKLSPKASATLSRRCIQGMIHDRWNIKLKNLNQEISSLQDEIEPSLWSAIDSLRQLGNIGAHMEKDVNTIVDIEPDEAQKLLTLVEILIKEWYIVPHEREELLSGINQINHQKQEKRKNTE